MRRTSRPVAATVAALALSAALGGCGSDDGDGKGENKPREKSTARQQPTSPPSASELDEQVLTTAELPKSLKKTFTSMAKRRTARKGRDVATPAPCQPILDRVSDQGDEKAAAAVRHRAQTANLSDNVAVALASYPDRAHATATLKTVTKAADGCARGFKSVNKKADYRDRYTRVTSKPGPEGGDASLRLDVKGVGTDGSGGTYSFDVLVIRTGNIVVSFSRYGAPERDGSQDVPSALITAQLKKVERTARGS